MQRLNINKLVFNKQLSPAGAAQQNTIGGSAEDFTHDSLSLRKTLNKSLGLSLYFPGVLGFPSPSVSLTRPGKQMGKRAKCEIFFNR